MLCSLPSLSPTLTWRHNHQPPWPCCRTSATPTPSTKLRLMCSYDNHIVPCPHYSFLCYASTMYSDIAEGLVLGTWDDVVIVAAHETKLGRCRCEELILRVDVAGAQQGFWGVGVGEVRWRGWGAWWLRLHGESEGEREGREQGAWMRFVFF